MTPRRLPRPIGALLIAVLMQAFMASGGRAQSGQDLLDAMKAGGHVLLMRHATAPGTGDPPGFRLDSCDTQRNLDDRGREEARRAGAALREAGIVIARVYASRWCRAVDTARLMAGDQPVMSAPEALDSFFQNRERRDASTAALRALIAGLPRDAGNTLMVTHQVNVTALTGIFPRSGDIVVLRLEADGFSILGRMMLP